METEDIDFEREERRKRREERRRMREAARAAEKAAAEAAIEVSNHVPNPDQGEEPHVERRRRPINDEGEVQLIDEQPAVMNGHVTDKPHVSVWSSSTTVIVNNGAMVTNKVTVEQKNEETEKKQQRPLQRRRTMQLVAAKEGEEDKTEFAEMHERLKQDDEQRMKELWEQRQAERERKSMELLELAERREKRKREREAENVARLEKEKEIKEKLEEEARHRKEQEEIRKEQALEIRRNNENASKNKVIMKIGKHLNLKENIRRAKEDGHKTSSELKRQKEAAMSERVPELDLSDRTSRRELVDVAQDFHARLAITLGTVYDLKQRKKRQNYDINELNARLKTMKNVTNKFNMLSIGQVSRVSRFRDTLAEDQNANTTIKSHYQREREEGSILGRGGVKGRLAMFEQGISHPKTLPSKKKLY
ncbi:uncharacterized protein LOC100372190 [Saccoglossus kowalevskii]|uniref:Stress response protein nst-1-like n=1 Tax=Saccoglossus kowalevskii TaxID=10224 RepID=A0ABM0GYK4_SACKO|nr:PREDICTED: stress response protein nst-1-like [Saccoglossus kowalevskii]